MGLMETGIEKKRHYLGLKGFDSGYSDPCCELIDLAPVGLFETDGEGNCCFVNQKWREISGLSLDGALGLGWVNGIHPEDRDAVNTAWYKSATSGLPFSLTYRFETPKHKITWVRGNSTAIKKPDNKIVGYIGSIVDISDQIASESLLKENYRQSEGLVKAMVDREERIIELKEEIERLKSENSFLRERGKSS